MEVPVQKLQTAGALSHLKRDRISSQCVCCASENLKRSPAILMPFLSHRIFGWAPVTIDDSWGLSTIKNGHAYSICNSLLCSECGFLFLDIRFSDSELNSLYHDYRGEEYNNLREQYEPGYTLRNTNLNAGIGYIDEIESFLKPHVETPVRLLDWGGDTGKNTPFKTQAKVFDVYDISNKSVIDGARRVNKEEAFRNPYNLIICSNVLEHVPYPSDLLLDIKKIMQADSVLYLEVPMEAVIREHEIDPHLKKKHWHEHINFYSETSLRRLIEHTGLDVIDLYKLHITAEGKEACLFQVACRLKTS
jgi:hypothetical protein